MQRAQAGTLCEWVLHLLQLYSAYNLGQVPALGCFACTILPTYILLEALECAVFSRCIDVNMLVLLLLLCFQTCTSPDLQLQMCLGPPVRQACRRPCPSLSPGVAGGGGGAARRRGGGRL